MSSTMPSSPASICVEGHTFHTDYMTNVSDTILSKIGARLHMQSAHPLGIIRKRIEEYFSRSRSLPYAGRQAESDAQSYSFKCYTAISPVVTTVDNFDRLCFPPNHPGRSRTDTYYLNATHLLRTHTTAHDVSLLSTQSEIHRGKFITIGDVYRRDEIDSVHYPVFHQVDGVSRFSASELSSLEKKYSLDGVVECVGAVQDEHRHNNQIGSLSRHVSLVVHDMKREIEGLMRLLFGPDVSFQWVPGEFPFTFPSYELEIMYKGMKLEVCGCGILKDSILKTSDSLNDDASIMKGSQEPSIAWAFGLGLERLAMVLFDIPDIRYFWSKDPRFLSQFSAYMGDVDIGTFQPVKFSQFSKYPPISRDLSFWLPAEFKSERDFKSFDHNTVYEIMREEAGDLVESVGVVSL